MELNKCQCGSKPVLNVLTLKCGAPYGYDVSCKRCKAECEVCATEDDAVSTWNTGKASQCQSTD